MSTAPKIFKSDPIWHDNGKLQINLVQFKSSLHAQRWSPFVKVILLPFKSRDSPHLKWRRFIIGWRFFIKLISRRKKNTILFRKIAISKKSRYFKQLKPRDSKDNSVRFSQMVPSKRDDQIRLYASRKSSLQWVTKRDSGFPENHAVSRWSLFALAS